MSPKMCGGGCDEFPGKIFCTKKCFEQYAAGENFRSLNAAWSIARHNRNIEKQLSSEESYCYIDLTEENYREDICKFCQQKSDRHIEYREHFNGDSTRKKIDICEDCNKKLRREVYDFVIKRPYRVLK